MYLKMSTPDERSINKRPVVGFYDFVFISIGILCLSLTLPVLFRWFEFAQTKRWAVGTTLFVGIAALFLYARRPNAIRDRVAPCLDIYDFFLIGSVWFFANATLHNFVRWGGWNQTPHRMLIVFTLGFITLLAAFCLFTRGSSQRLVLAFFFLSFMGFVDGAWKFTTGTASPKWLISVPREYAYGSFVFAVVFLFAGLITVGLKKRG